MTTTYNKQVLLKRGNTAVSSTYIGPVGEVTVDTDLDTIRVHDGVTPGGRLATSSQSGITPPSSPRENMLWYDTAGGRLYVYYDGAWVDASPAGDQEVIARINSLDANVGTLSTNVQSLNANIGTFETATNNRIQALDANIGTFETIVNSEISQFETAVSGTVNTINSNINALNATIAGFEGQPGPTSDAWVDNAPPDISNVGALWYDANGGRLYVQYDSTWVDASPTTVDLGKFVFDSDGDSAFISTTDDAGASPDRYDIVLIPGGEGNSSIRVPSQANSLAGFPLVIAATAANSAVVINTDTGSWTFGNTGILTLPTDGSIDTYSGTGGFKITTDGQIQFASGHSIGGSDTGLGLRMATDRGTILFGNHPEVQITSSHHFHIMAQDPGATDLFFGSDENFVKLPRGTNDVVIGNGNNYNWQFGDQGTLTVPGAITMPDETGLYSPGHDLYITAGNTTGCSVPGGDTIISSGLGYSGVAHNGGNVTLRTGDYYNKVWNFDYNGNLTLPAGGDILDSTGASVLGGAGGGTIWTNDANGCLRVELSSTGFEAFTDSSHVDLKDSGIWSIGSYGNSTWIGNNEFANLNDLSLRSGDATFITTNLRENGNHQWKFGTNGTLTIPGDIISTAGPAITFATTFDGNIAPEIHIKASKLTFIADSAYLNDIVDNTLPFNGVPAMSWNMEGEVLTWTSNSEIFASTSIFKMPHSDSANVGVIAMTGPSGGSELSWHGGTDYGRPIGQFIKSSANVSISTNAGFKWWIFGDDGTTAFPGYTFQASDGTAGQALVTDGSGSVTWTTLLGPNGNANTGNFTFVDDTLAVVDNGDIALQTNGKNWTFMADGRLILPLQGKISGTDVNSFLTFNYGDDVELKAGDNLFLSGSVATIRTNSNANQWTFGNDGNLTLPPGGDIRDSVSNISVLKTRIGDTYASGAFQQLTIAHDEGKLITIGGGNSLFRLPQLTADLLGAEFEFYFSADAGQVYLQAYYTDNRATTDLFRGSVFVGVDNSAQGRLHTATAGVADANYLFLGQHHAKAGSYIKFKAIAFDSVGTWLVQGQCVGDTVNTTPNGQSYIFQNYYD